MTRRWKQARINEQEAHFTPVEKAAQLGADIGGVAELGIGAYKYLAKGPKLMKAISAVNKASKAGNLAHGMEFLHDGLRMVDQPFKPLVKEWNLSDAVVNKSHHNWNKIFGIKKPTLSDVKPILEEAVANGTWKTTDVVRNPGGKVVGNKLELVQEVNGNKIWVGAMKEHSTGKIIINNGAVQ